MNARFHRLLFAALAVVGTAGSAANAADAARMYGLREGTLLPTQTIAVPELAARIVDVRIVEGEARFAGATEGLKALRPRVSNGALTLPAIVPGAGSDVSVVRVSVGEVSVFTGDLSVIAFPGCSWVSTTSGSEAGWPDCPL